MNIVSPSADFDWKLAQLVDGYMVGITLSVAPERPFDFYVDTIEYSAISSVTGTPADGFVALYGRRVTFFDDLHSAEHVFADHQEHICLIDIGTLVVY